MNALDESLVNDMAIIAYIGAQMGDFDRSNTIHTGLRAIDPENQHLTLASAVNDVIGSNYIEALKKLNGLVTKDESFHEARSWLGFCQALSGNIEGGRENLNTVMEQTEPGVAGYEIAKELKRALGSKLG